MGSEMTVVDAATDQQLLRSTFGCFPSGVTALCALVDGEPVGMAVSSFTSVSLDPPLVSVCVANTSTTWPRLRDPARLGVSVLGETHDVACRQLSARDGDRFAGISWRASGGGALFVADSAAALECELVREVAAGDHLIALLRVHALSSDTNVTPLVFHHSRFRQLVAH
ncbi:flavin reductase family protein [Frankia sp. AiPs1]|uniref:flavin reductase family protein n=1 Tax=Frankia sp. AiPs1 TaxID=573493 RepID=UPI0020446645|nr:flavin reductase family protein [Frankia sp. AiPs1]MCM3922273.1 flavin reductase family protein [Frankia sp. AiPs1]